MSARGPSPQRAHARSGAARHACSACRHRAGAMRRDMTRSPRFAVALALLLAVCACQTLSPEARVRQRLIEAGLKPRMAQCMAERLTDRLSIGQLRELGRAARLPGRDVGNMTVDELVYRLRAVGDPQIVKVVTRSGIGCVIAG